MKNEKECLSYRLGCCRDGFLALLLTAWAVAWMFVQAWAHEPPAQVSDTQINIAIEALEE